MVVIVYLCRHLLQRESLIFKGATFLRLNGVEHIQPEPWKTGRMEEVFGNSSLIVVLPNHSMC